MTPGIWPAIQLGLLDMHGDLRRFSQLVVCLAVGTALIAGVGTVGSSIRQAVERDAAVIVGGDVELSRSDRPATADELATIAGFGAVATVIDTNVRAQSPSSDAFVDLISVGDAYPLVGQVGIDGSPADGGLSELLATREGLYGTLVDPVLLDKLGASVGDTIQLAGTPFEARGTLGRLPDGAVRGFRLGLPALISTEGFATLSDLTSPLPGLGTYYRYKVLSEDRDSGQLREELGTALGDTGWTIRTPRDALGPMVRYYDLFMRFLVLVGLASLLIAGVSVWTGVSAYVSERAGVIAVMRSVGAGRLRVLVHFLAQVGALSLIGVGTGLLLGAAIGLFALPIVGEAIGVALPPSLHAEPLLVAAAVGLVTAFGFSYLPLQQALNIEPIILFRSRGLASPPFNWFRLVASAQVIPVIAAAVAFAWLALVMTGDLSLVAGFLIASAIAVAVFRLATMVLIAAIRRLPEPRNPIVRRALRGISDPDSNSPSIIISIGMALAMLIVVLALGTNLNNEYLGASVFDVPTFVASDLFGDEVDQLMTMRGEETGIVDATATPMLRGAVTAVNGRPAGSLAPRGPEALFLLSTDVPLTYRAQLPPTSRLVAGNWWPPDYAGAALVSLHQSLRTGLGVEVGDTLTFDVFGDSISATVANFRDYSWQGGIDFLVAFSPGVLEAYPATLLGAVKAAPGREDEVERALAAELPFVRFVAIGETLDQITKALGQLSLAASLVGGLAVGNGLLVLTGSLAAGRQQRHADALITTVLGARKTEIVGAFVLQFFLLAVFAAILATALGLTMARMLTQSLLDVDFTVNTWVLSLATVGAVATVAAFGATTVLGVFRTAPARLLRRL